MLRWHFTVKAHVNNVISPSQFGRFTWNKLAKQSFAVSGPKYGFAFSCCSLQVMKKIPINFKFKFTPLIPISQIIRTANNHVTMHKRVAMIGSPFAHVHKYEVTQLPISCEAVLRGAKPRFLNRRSKIEREDFSTCRNSKGTNISHILPEKVPLELRHWNLALPSPHLSLESANNFITFRPASALCINDRIDDRNLLESGIYCIKLLIDQSTLRNNDREPLNAFLLEGYDRRWSWSIITEEYNGLCLMGTDKISSDFRRAT